MQIIPWLCVTVDSKKNFAREEEGGIKEGRKEGRRRRRRGRNERGALLGVAKLPTHPTSFFP